MKSVICLVLATLLTAGVAGCAYEHHEYARAAYTADDFGYYPEPHYSSHWDYYRHYKGIDG